MIICDTNLISEAMKAQPDICVKAWLNQQVAHSLYVTSISLAEVYFGLARLSEGQRKTDLNEVMTFTLNKLFASRILGFDQPAAQCYATITARAERQGLAIRFADGQIAAIAAHHGFSVATRDIKPFLAAQVEVINPWQFQ